MTGDRAERIGLWVSGIGHGAVILWVALGGFLFRAQPGASIRMTNVATISEAEFQTMAAATRGAGPVADTASVTPAQPRPPSADNVAGGVSSVAPPAPNPRAEALPAPTVAPEAAPDLSQLRNAQAPVEAATVAPQTVAPNDDGGAPLPGAQDRQAASLSAPPRVRPTPELPGPAPEPALAPGAQPSPPPPPAALPEPAPLPPPVPEATPTPEPALAPLDSPRPATAAAARAAREAAAQAAREAEAQAQADREDERAAAEARAEREAAAAQEAARAEAQARAERQARDRAEAEARARERADQRRQAAEAAQRKAAEDEAAAEAARVQAAQRAAEEKAAQEAEAARRDAQAENDALAKALEQALTETAPQAQTEAQASTDDAARTAPDIPRDNLTHALEEAIGEPLGAAPELDGAGMAPDGPPLSQGEKDGVNVPVSKRWRVGTLSREAQGISVSLQLSLTPDGHVEPDSIILLENSPGSEAAIRQAFEVARRAIEQADAQEGGFSLPADKYARWKTMILDFPAGGSLGVR